MLKFIPKSVIYHFSNEQGFGDRWASVNFLLKTSERTNKVVFTNSWHKDYPNILKQLKSTGTIQYTHTKGNTYISNIHAWQSPYCQTNKIWSPNSKTICYQLDGRWQSNKKNLSPIEYNKLFSYLEGYKTINLGGMRKLSEIVEIMSTSMLFIGVPSGISHVACSVGIPAYIICKPAMKPDLHKTEVYYGKKNITIFTSVNEFQLVDLL